MIHFQNEHQYPIDQESLTQAIQAALLQQNAPSFGEITLVVVDDEEIQAFNRDYRGEDKPTDILSFSYGEIDPDSIVPYLGDLILSYPKAFIQAEAFGHTIQEELQILVVHGALHLLGHDHYDADEKAVMWAAQDAILTTLNVKARPTDK